MPEIDDLVSSLQRQRFFLTNTARELTDDQARTRPTVSALSIGGLFKHVGLVERQWVEFIRIGPDAMSGFGDPATMAAWVDAFSMSPQESLADVLGGYRAVAERTDEFVRGIPDLDATQPLPRAPWFEPGAVWSARKVVLHLIGEISQHAGHADIIRESIDGARSMG